MAGMEAGSLTHEKTMAAFNAATNFHEAAIRCLPSLALPTIMPMAMIVNIAFACELYFKTNLIALGNNTHGHDLQALFKELPEDQQAQIAARYTSGVLEPTIQLDVALGQVGRAFVDWRYVYERQHSGVAIGALWRLARVLFVHTDGQYRDPDMTGQQRSRLATS